jgi:hypothetical protein
LCDSVSSKDFAKIERYALPAEEGGSGVVHAGGRAYEREVVVCILELGIVGVDFVDEEGYGFVVFVAFYGPSWTHISSSSTMPREYLRIYLVCKMLEYMRM